MFKCSHCSPGFSSLFPTLDHLTSKYRNQDITDHNSTILGDDEHEAAIQLAMKAKTELSALQTHIDDAISHIEMLKREAEHYKNALLAHQTTISPIRTLPPELLHGSCSLFWIFQRRMISSYLSILPTLAHYFRQQTRLPVHGHLVRSVIPGGALPWDAAPSGATYILAFESSSHEHQVV